MAALFTDVPTHRVIPVIRAFSLFALLANVAEDLHQERRRRIHTAAGEPPPDGDLAATWARLDQTPPDPQRLATVRATARVAPVLTAHPTETRRRTVFEVTRRILGLMRRRDSLHTGPRDRVTEAELEAIELAIRRQILTLWQTAIIRSERPRISDEVVGGLQYHEATLMDRDPAAQRGDRRATGLRRPADGPPRLVDRRGSRRQPVRHRGRGAVRHRPGRRAAAPALRPPAAAARAGTVPVAAPGGRARRTARPRGFTRRDPRRGHRRAGGRPVSSRRVGGPASPRGAGEVVVVVGIGAGTAAGTSPGAVIPRRSDDEATTAHPYTSPAQMLADLDVIDAALARCGGDLLRTPRLRDLRWAVRTFGFHLQALDMRQNSESHEDVLGELFALAGVSEDYSALDEDARVELLLSELSHERPLLGPRAELSETAERELGVMRAAAAAVELLGPEVIPHYIVSMCGSVSDLLEPAILLREVGLFSGHPHAPRSGVWLTRCWRPSTTWRPGIRRGAGDPPFRELVRGRRRWR